jgi:hypothetical protein
MSIGGQPGEFDGTYTEVDDLAGDHQGEELFRGSRKSVADGLTNVHGDLGDSSKLILSLLSDLVFTGHDHDMKSK